MKINFGTEITDFDGNPVQNGKAGPLLAGTACAQALLHSQIPDDQPDGAEKVARFTLAQKVHGNGMVDLEAKEIVTILGVAEKVWGTLVYGRLHLLLNGKG